MFENADLYRTNWRKRYSDTISVMTEFHCLSLKLICLSVSAYVCDLTEQNRKIYSILTKDFISHPVFHSFIRSVTRGKSSENKEI